MKEIVICPTPILFPNYYQEGDTAIIVDVLRASTTICSMLHNGASDVIPVTTVEDALKYKEKDYLVGAERDAKKCSFADFGNSPFEYRTDEVKGKTIVFSTTNGTRSIELSSDAEQIVIGSFTNISVIENFCKKKSRIIVVCAGWKNRFDCEDMLFGGALIERMSKHHGFSYDYDSSLMSLLLWEKASNNILKFLSETEHYKRMKKNGLLDDLRFCMKEDEIPVLPIYNKSKKIITL